MIEKHSMHWFNRWQQFGCSCGDVLYDGGEHKSRAQHRQHKDAVGQGMEVCPSCGGTGMRQVALGETQEVTE